MTRAWSPRILSLLRIMSALLFLEHGIMKLFDFPGSMAFQGGDLSPMLLVAALIEVIGGVLLLLGLFTRTTAFICSGEMAAAYFIGHYPAGFWPGSNHGGEAILYCFIFLYFVFAGAGAWSIDSMRRRRR